MVVYHRSWNFWFLTVTIQALICTNIVNVKGTETNKTRERQWQIGSQNEERLLVKKNRTKDDFISYVAEWEYGGNTPDEEQDWDEYSGQLSPLAGKESHTQSAVPSKRVGPATWQDASGSWWLFGGQGPNPLASDMTTTNFSIQFLSDLWLYEAKQEPTVWKSVFQSQRDFMHNKQPISSYPDNLAFPLLCGSYENRHVTVFGSSNSRPSSQNTQNSDPNNTNSHNSLFTDDNIVWLYDIPKREEHKFPSSNETTEQGVWTSYICCDACLPDDNTTTLEFCPHFSDGGSGSEAILWCSQDSLMALQLTSSKSLHKSSDQVEKIESGKSITGEFSAAFKNQSGNHFFSGSGSGATFSTKEVEKSKAGDSPAHLGEISSTNAISKNKSNEEFENIIYRTEIEKIRINSTKSMSGPPRIVKDDAREESLGLNWWKFDLAATEWEKMPKVIVPSEKMRAQIFSQNCRSVSDQLFVYILCPLIPSASKEKKHDSLIRDVFVFDPRRNSIYWLSQLQLNNAFRDERIWQLGRSILYALQSDNQTVIFLAYQKLLDLWIHDHSTGRLSAVENVWRGSTLHKFQTWSSFYKLRITIPSGSQGEGAGKKQNSHIVFMANPRTKLFTFNDPRPATPTSFHITIETDQSVFLPSRDASFLINPEDQVSKSSNASLVTPTLQSAEPGPGPELLTVPTSKPKSISLPLLPKTNIIGSLSLTNQSPIPVTEKSQTNVIDFNSISGNGPSMMTKTIKVIPSGRTTSKPASFQGLKSNLGNAQDNDNMPKTSSISSFEIRWNANISNNPNTTTSISNSSSTSTTTSEGKRTDSESNVTVTVTHTSTSHSHPGLSKHLFGIKRSFVKGTIDPPKLEVSSSSTVNNESRVGEPLQESSNTTGTSPESTTRTSTRTISTQPGPGIINLNYNNENRKKIMKPAVPVTVSINENQSKPRTPNFETDVIPLEVKNLNSFSKINHMDQNQKVNDSRDFISKIKYSNSYSNAEIVVTADSNPPHPHSPGTKNGVGKNIGLTSADEIHVSDTNQNSAEQNEHEHEHEENKNGMRSPLTYSSSDVLIDQTILSGPDGDLNGGNNNNREGSSYSSIIFFAISISFFATIGIILFVRRCVKCPPRRQSVLLKEPPPIRYSVIPDELSYHTPIV